MLRKIEIRVIFFWKMLVGPPVSISPGVTRLHITPGFSLPCPTQGSNIGPLGCKVSVLLSDLSPESCLACDNLFQSVFWKSGYDLPFEKTYSEFK